MCPFLFWAKVHTVVFVSYYDSPRLWNRSWIKNFIRLVTKFDIRQIKLIKHFSNFKISRQCNSQSTEQKKIKFYSPDVTTLLEQDVMSTTESVVKLHFAIERWNVKQPETDGKTKSKHDSGPSSQPTSPGALQHERTTSCNFYFGFNLFQCVAPLISHFGWYLIKSTTKTIGRISLFMYRVSALFDSIWLRWTIRHGKTVKYLSCVSNFQM